MFTFTIVPLNRSPLREGQNGLIFLSIITGSWDMCIEAGPVSPKKSFLVFSGGIK